MKLEEAISNPRFNNEIHKATINLLSTAHWLKTKMSNYLKNLDLTTEQYNIMRILKGKHPVKMCVKDLSFRMYKKSSNVPRILDRLERKGLIDRNQSAEDKRETETILTKKGILHLHMANEQVKINEEKLMNLDEETARKLNVMLKNLRNLEE
ncbi:MAG: MarR family transcriptional regulator [Opitutaceae bacterium]|nr:MarR family transcriptional regulator [Cytophagales bacterium]